MSHVKRVAVSALIPVQGEYTQGVLYTCAQAAQLGWFPSHLLLRLRHATQAVETQRLFEASSSSCNVCFLRLRCFGFTAAGWNAEDAGSSMPTLESSAPGCAMMLLRTCAANYRKCSISSEIGVRLRSQVKKWCSDLVSLGTIDGIWQNTAAQGDVARPYLGMTILCQHGSQTADTRHGSAMSPMTKARALPRNSRRNIFSQGRVDPWYTPFSPPLESGSFEGSMTRVSIDDFKQWMIFTDSKTSIPNNQLSCTRSHPSIEKCPICHDRNTGRPFISPPRARSPSEGPEGLTRRSSYASATKRQYT